jgi:hypothetical protein
MGSPWQSKVLAIAPKFTALLSFCGSFGIILKVLSNARSRKKTMHRILMGMSICDLLVSIWYFAGTWVIPAGTLSEFGDTEEAETIFWATGDDLSCSFAGFFNQFAVASPLYNLALGVFYLLVVNYDWKDNRIAKIEWIFHAIPVGYALFTSTFAAAANLYGQVEWTCWINPNPQSTPIQSLFKLTQWIFLFGPVWISFFSLMLIFGILYRKMRILEKKLSRYTMFTVLPNAQSSTQYRSSINFVNNSNGNGNDNGNGSGNNDDRARAETKKLSKSQKIAKQGLWFGAAFYVTWTFPTVTRFMGFVGKQRFPIQFLFAIQFLDTFLLPLQGFLNFVVYIRPQFLIYRTQNADDGFWKSFKNVVFETNVDRSKSRARDFTVRQASALDHP